MATRLQPSIDEMAVDAYRAYRRNARLRKKLFKQMLAAYGYHVEQEAAMHVFKDDDVAILDPQWKIVRR